MSGSSELSLLTALTSLLGVGLVSLPSTTLGPAGGPSVTLPRLPDPGQIDSRYLRIYFRYIYARHIYTRYIYPPGVLVTLRKLCWDSTECFLLCCWGWDRRLRF